MNELEQIKKRAEKATGYYQVGTDLKCEGAAARYQLAHKDIPRLVEVLEAAMECLGYIAKMKDEARRKSIACAVAKTKIEQILSGESDE